MNCRTCIHNRYEPAMQSGDPEDGMINNCHQPDMTAAIAGLDSEAAEVINVWMQGQNWDAECLCPVETTPCPGYEAKP